MSIYDVFSGGNKPFDKAAVPVAKGRKSFHHILHICRCCRHALLLRLC